MIVHVLALLKTWFDIIRLRKGPDAVPRSPVVFALAVALWLASGIAFVLMIEGFDMKDFIVGILTGVTVLLCYAAILNFCGKAERTIQTLSAIVGCGALLTFAMAAGNLILVPLVGAGLTGNIVFLIFLWSVPVEGHIISRAIDRHFLFGLALALAALFFQIYVDLAVNPLETP